MVPLINNLYIRRKRLLSVMLPVLPTSFLITDLSVHYQLLMVNKKLFLVTLLCFMFYYDNKLPGKVNCPRNVRAGR